ncbi:hypothetical protein VM95_29910 [Streptomyces rubellomurinus]|uniref:Uncharacterized protein n=2 Tax=Streptomyces rubellomurinus (strain ATCC 31215) TaxID=359131 RepID=A0A0F2T9D0_STRR3|nr:hypothetical protein VM95_29910 [Streptomyces rubellomurinus]
MPFEQELCGLVLDSAPRLFAVVQVCGEGREDADGWVVAWGLADEDGRAHVIGIDGRTRMTLASPERVLRHFGRRPGVSARLVWLAEPGGAALDRGEAA